VCQPSIWSANGQRALLIPHKSANEAVGSNKTHQSRHRCSECLCSAECGTWLCDYFLGTQFLVVCASPQSGAPHQWSEGSFDTSRKRQRSCRIQQDARIEEPLVRVSVHCRMWDLVVYEFSRNTILSCVCQRPIWSADGQRALSIPYESANEAVGYNKTHESR
jgi:hypothetical protein